MDKRWVLWLTQETSMARGVDGAVKQFHQFTRVFLENTLRLALLLANESFPTKEIS